MTPRGFGAEKGHDLTEVLKGSVQLLCQEDTAVVQGQKQEDQLEAVAISRAETDGSWLQGGSGEKWSDPDVLFKYNDKYLDELEVDVREREWQLGYQSFHLSHQNDGAAIHRAREG